MGEYAVTIAPKAKRQLKKLDRSTKKRIVAVLGKLELDPRPKGVEKLTQMPNLWRVRCGDYRVTYHIADDTDVVTILVVRHRKDAYRDINKLNPGLLITALGPLLAEILDQPRPS